jgi:hypothetical protein
MPIRIDKFSGEVPAIIPRLLPGSSAQIAQNVRLEDGSLLPFRCGKLVHTFGSAMQTIYRHNGAWLGWPGVVKVAPAPIADDRLYVTGDGVPKVITGGVSYPLKVPSPTAALTVSQPSPVDPALSVTFIYTYTWVTFLGEESEPAPLSEPVTSDPSKIVLLSGFQAAPTDRLFRYQNIYRSQTSVTGETNLFLIGYRLASNAVDFEDPTNGYYPVLDPLPSMDYNPPPDGLQGITALPNGIMAGFVGKRLYFSQPYVPHAWPEKYVLTTEYEIVGLGVFGQSVAVLTTGHPYVVSGISPDSMSMERLKVNLACVSARGIVDLGYAVAYPSAEGLVSISSGGAQLMTGGLFTREIWQALGPATMIGGHSNGRYIATYTIGGETGLLIVDTTGQQPFLIRASDTAGAMWNESGTGRLFLLQGGTKVFEWDSAESPHTEMLWRSKLHVLPGHANFGALLVEGVDTMTDAERSANRTRWNLADLAASVEVVGEPPFWLEPEGEGLLDPSPAPTPGFCAVIYADDRPVHVVTDLNRPARLPSGFLALSWEVEIRGTMRVTAVSLAGSPAELTQP